MHCKLEKHMSVYDIANDRWSQPPLDDNQAHGAMFGHVLVDGSIMLLGGGSEAISTFNLQTKQWTKSDANALKCPQYGDYRTYYHNWHILSHLRAYILSQLAI